jgi:hypothetical protein
MTMKLDVKAFALTCALMLGGGILLATWGAIAFVEDAASYNGILTRIYWGYSMTPVGSLVGLAWGLGEGLVGGAVFAVLYNALSGKGE